MGCATDEEIAFCLHWHIASVIPYLCKWFQDVGTIMRHTLEGAFKIS
jgi:hypothetical protein